MKKIKKLIVFGLSLCMMMSLVGCSSYKFNYEDDNVKFQYDEDLLQVTPSVVEGSTDLFIHTKDGYYIAYVNTSLIECNYENPKQVLDNMQTYFVSLSPDSVVEEESVTKAEGEYNGVDTTITEYNYKIIDNEGLVQIVKSKIETIGIQHFISIYRYYEDSYGEDTLNALQLTYDSSQLNI